MVTYYGDLQDKPIREYFPVTHGGYASEKAMREIGLIAGRSGVSFSPGTGLNGWCDTLNSGVIPRMIKYRMDGKYHRIVSREWP